MPKRKAKSKQKPRRQTSAIASTRSAQRETERARTDPERWWDEYRHAAAPKKLRLVRGLIADFIPRNEDEEELVREAVSELHGRVSDSDYVDLLEDLSEQRPELFAQAADWYVRDLCHWYAAANDWKKISAMVEDYAQTLEKCDESTFEILLLLRLAGLARPAEQLTTAMLARIDCSGLMPWAEDELVEAAAFFPVRAFIEAGARDEDFDETQRRVEQLGSAIDPDWHREILRHRSGKTRGVWTQEELTQPGETASRNIFLLFEEFACWLGAERDFPPVTAEMIRWALIHTFDSVEDGKEELFCGLCRESIEPQLASMVGFLSQQQLRALAVVVGLYHLYDFLLIRGLVDDDTHDKTHALCDGLWDDLKLALQDAWHEYRFVERYLPA